MTRARCELRANCTFAVDAGRVGARKNAMQVRYLLHDGKRGSHLREVRGVAWARGSFDFRKKHRRSGCKPVIPGFLPESYIIQAGFLLCILLYGKSNLSLCTLSLRLAKWPCLCVPAHLLPHRLTWTPRAQTCMNTPAHIPHYTHKKTFIYTHMPVVLLIHC